MIIWKPFFILNRTGLQIKYNDKARALSESLYVKHDNDMSFCAQICLTTCQRIRAEGQGPWPGKQCSTAVPAACPGFKHHS